MKEAGTQCTVKMECEPGLRNNDTSALGPLNLRETDDEEIAGNAQVRNVFAKRESGNTQPEHGKMIHKSSVSEVRYEEILKKGHFSKSKTVVKIFKGQVTDKYKHFVRVCKRLRCAFLVPMLKSIDEPSSCFRVRSPFMLGGNVESLLSRKMSDYTLDKRALVITIACQISEGIAFLHERNIVHGDINLRHILVDQHEIVRLVDYGMYTHRTDESHVDYGEYADTVTAVAGTGTVESKVHFTADVRSFAAVILQLVKPSVFSTVAELLHNLSQTGTETLEQDYFDEWPADNIASETVKVVLECFRSECSSTAFSKLNERLNEIMKLFKPALPLVPAVSLKGKEYPDCLYCSLQPVHPELRLRSTSCPETCPYLCACQSCIVTFGSYCHVDNDVCEHRESLNSGYVEYKCPVHKCTIEPAIGGERAFAMILRDNRDTGNRDTDEDFRKRTKNDARNMAQLAGHPKVMKMPYKNVYRCLVSISGKADSENIRQCQYLERKMKEISDGKPSYFLFYYTGHQLVSKDNKSEPSHDIVQLVKILREYITEIARKCPRILMIFDCCYAAAAAKLFSIQLDNYANVEWHVQWFSSCQEQESDAAGRQMSVFTELVVSSLKGGTERQCPHETLNCKMCSAFRKSCAENGYICFRDSAEFVGQHMHSWQCKTQECPSDVQTPGFNETVIGIHKPVISFFSRESKLYTFRLKSAFDGTINKFQTDKLHPRDIWCITREHRPVNANHLKIFERYSMQLLRDYYVDGQDLTVTDVKHILEAVSIDNKCLLVQIDETAAENEQDMSSETEDTEDSCSDSPSQAENSSDDFIQFADSSPH